MAKNKYESLVDKIDVKTALGAYLTGPVELTHKQSKDLRIVIENAIKHPRIKDRDFNKIKLVNILKAIDDGEKDLEIYRDTILNFLPGGGAISSRQRKLRTCQLPYNDHIASTAISTCTKNSAHVFCKFHRLDQCVICGADLQ